MNLLPSNYFRLQRDMDQWNDIDKVLTESMDWINQTRRIEHDWKIYPLEEQIRRTEVSETMKND